MLLRLHSLNGLKAKAKAKDLMLRVVGLRDQGFLSFGVHVVWGSGEVVGFRS